METKTPESSTPSSQNREDLAQEILKDMDAQSLLDDYINPATGEANVEIIFSDKTIVANIQKDKK